MESRDDKLIAIIGLLAACLIGVTFLFTMVWLTDVRHPADPSLDVQSCHPKKPPAQHV
ncbi:MULTISPECIES: hypothetical protein [Pantoea]|jgi:hypothetical protein|uniref:hypothetical protein n=1 Tax=Pantoea TaxID=53335 RepID=UPI0002586B6E|nr:MULTISPECIES: hypothetical protein [Pantoea]KAF6662559.1 hypothetical protein HFD91_03055 [Enterobacteriaceae bacterium EKM102V]EIB99254.1 hypothetical protein S7A_12115 [Pantoea sp. Sc1]KAF6667383.1 hypothetical protein HFD92_04535 [Pantoea sp. EKM101V]KAF6671025.1 hypothetical protein HFD97_03060 [Pantoea sp. EKM103V]MEB5705233.1 hypothetical protein [Pantoea anthophila]